MIRKFATLQIALLFGCVLSLQAQPQTSCSNTSLNGNYFYLISGALAAGSGSASYAELGELTTDGKGGVYGHSTASVGGETVTFTLTGSYAIQGNCTGKLSLNLNLQSFDTITFQIVDGGKSAILAFSSPGGVVAGKMYRAPSGGPCGDASLTGGYGFLLSGYVSLQNGTFLYSDAGQIVSNGSGVLSTISAPTLGAGATVTSGTGTYSIASSCLGSVNITDSNGAASYIVAVVEGGSVLFLSNTTGSTIAGSAQPQLSESVLPQFVFGGGWYSALYFTNTNASAVSFPVSFTADTGTPLTVPGLGSSTQVTLAPNGSTILEAPNVGSLSEGYVALALPAGVSGFGIFRQSLPGIADQEAVVPLSSASATRATLAWDDTQYTTAVAIANPSSVPVNVSITVWDGSGNVIGISSVSLASQSKTEAVLRSLAGLGGMAGKRGTASFSVTSGNVAVLGLRFNGSAFSSIPTANQ